MPLWFRERISMENSVGLWRTALWQKVIISFEHMGLVFTLMQSLTTRVSLVLAVLSLTSVLLSFGMSCAEGLDKFTIIKARFYFFSGETAVTEGEDEVACRCNHWWDEIAAVWLKLLLQFCNICRAWVEVLHFFG